MYTLPPQVAVNAVPLLSGCFIRIFVGGSRQSFLYHYGIAGVAQLVEQRIRNAKVEGSIPFTGTTK